MFMHKNTFTLKNIGKLMYFDPLKKNGLCVHIGQRELGMSTIEIQYIIEWG